MQTTKCMIFHACAYFVRLQVLICYINTCLQRMIDSFCKKSGFECCFWSAHFIETQARTSDNVKTWVFFSVIVKSWSFKDKSVYMQPFTFN